MGDDMKPTRRNILKSCLAAVGAALIPVAVLFRKTPAQWEPIDCLCWDGERWRTLTWQVRVMR